MVQDTQRPGAWIAGAARVVVAGAARAEVIRGNTRTGVRMPAGVGVDAAGGAGVEVGVGVGASRSPTAPGSVVWKVNSQSDRGPPSFVPVTIQPASSDRPPKTRTRNRPRVTENVAVPSAGMFPCGSTATKGGTESL